MQLHHVADFYEVLPLRDACCNFLLETLRSDNCCELLRRSQEVHFDLLLHRCKDFLTFDFTSGAISLCCLSPPRMTGDRAPSSVSSVVENDPGFPSLEHRILGEVLRRRDLVCREELQVLQAIVQWYTRQPSVDKYEQLRELLPLVRWSLLPSDAKRSEEVHLLISQLLPNLQPPESTRPSKRARKAAATPVSNPDLATAGDVQLLARSLYANACSGDKPSEPERQLKWGLLVERSEAREDAAQNSQADQTEYVLECTKQYMVGRSRRCDIRIGHKAPTPYISSQHFKVYHTIRWPTLQVNHSPSLPIERPSLEARLEDLSQNGTYVNGKQVERGKNVVLAHGDKIELVFSHWHVPVSYGLSLLASVASILLPSHVINHNSSRLFCCRHLLTQKSFLASPSSHAGQAIQTHPELLQGVRRMLHLRLLQVKLHRLVQRC